jgi:hypothetical protein
MRSPERFGQPIVSPGIEIDPALGGVRRLARDQQHLSAQCSGIRHHVAAGLDDDPRARAAKIVGKRLLDRLGVQVED